MVLLALLVVMASHVSAEVSVLSPVQITVKHGGTVKLGKAMPGETVRVVVSRDYGAGTWDNIAPTFMPENWRYNVVKESKSLVLELHIPRDAELIAVNIPTILESDGIDESVNFRLFVTNNLLSATIDKTFVETHTAEPAVFTLTLSNESVAAHAVRIGASLPEDWFDGEYVIVPARSNIRTELTVMPRFQGMRSFSFNVDSALNGRKLSELPVEMRVVPSLRGKFVLPTSALPAAFSIFGVYSLLSLLAYLS